MKQNAVKQLERTLNMLLPRFCDEFFTQAILTTQQESKAEEVVISAGHNGLVAKQKSRQVSLSADELIPYISRIALLADGLELRIVRRNETVVVQASARGVSVRMEKPLGVQSLEAEPLNATDARELLQALGFTDAKGEVRPGEMRKHNQINQFLKAASPVLRHLADRNGAFTLIDAACGKSPLSFVLNFYLSHVLRCKVNVVGIDISEGVIATANRIRDELGYRNAEYRVSSIADYNYNKEAPVGLVVSLHACDTATDEAIAAGVRLGAEGIIAVPCCQRELLGQIQPGDAHDPMAPIFRHGLLKARFADLLTDTIRGLALQANGYTVSMQEFCSPVDTPKNLMLRALRTGDAAAAAQAKQDYKALQARFGLRPSALGRLLE